MIGVHTNWSKPRKVPYQDWEILLQILSAEIYKKNYGNIKLICDPEALHLYERLGITDLYDDIEILDETLLEGINPDIYFAAGKLAAQLQVEEEACMFIDLDLILKPIERGFNFDYPYVFHRELPHSPYYPNDPNWNWPLPFLDNVYAANCALVYFPTKELRREYAALALKFMFANNNHGDYDPNVLMVTAEQRLLGIFLRQKGIDPGYFIHDIYIPGNTDELIWFSDSLGSNIKFREPEYVHVWGLKSHLLKSKLDAKGITLQLIEMMAEHTVLDSNEILYKLNTL